MPKRLIRPVLWLEHHISAHPGRLVATATVLLLASALMLTFSVWVSVNAGHSANVKVCRAVNELSRKIAVTGADLGWPEHHIVRFIPTDDCGDL